MTSLHSPVLGPDVRASFTVVPAVAFAGAVVVHRDRAAAAHGEQ
ncbi:hypothetical protein ACNPON_17575 [Glutamicibacter sp. AGC13]